MESRINSTLIEMTEFDGDQHLHERDLEEEPPPPGYPQLAVRMGMIPEAAIFRSFSTLNAQNLLYMQAELVDLERKLRYQQVRDEESGDPSRKNFARNWYYLKDEGGEQWRIFQEIQSKLAKFNSTLLSVSKIARMSPPTDWDLDHIQAYFATSEMGPYALTGDDSDLWGYRSDPKKHAKDLISLVPRPDKDHDLFSVWFMTKALRKLARMGCIRKRKDGKANGLLGIEDQRLLRWTYAITSLLCSVILLVSMSILYVVQPVKLRLGLIAVFNILLISILAAFTTAKRSEMFAIAAAYGAICVVFIQVQSGSCEST